jgi:hypothetical protein
LDLTEPGILARSRRHILRTRFVTTCDAPGDSQWNRVSVADQKPVSAHVREANWATIVRLILGHYIGTRTRPLIRHIAAGSSQQTKYHHSTSMDPVYFTAPRHNSSSMPVVHRQTSNCIVGLTAAP